MLMHTRPHSSCRRRWLAHYGLVALLAALPSASSTTVDTASCAACVQSFRLLSSKLSSEKARLELSKEANERKAQKVDKVQKAQTKRWLKNEYGVALRASLEEEMDVLCSRDALTSSAELRTACTRFVEAHEDELPRAVLDEQSALPFCEASVPGCNGETAEKAIKAHAKQPKSEAAPKSTAARVRGVVTRLVGKTYTKFVRDTTEQHVIVLLHNKATTAGKTREASDLSHASLIAEYYALASAVAASSGDDKDRFSFAQIDVSKNDVPSNTPLADKSGTAVLLYGLGERAEDPKSMPAVGEPSLAWAKSASARTQLTQFLLTYLPKRDQPLVSKLMQEREKNSKAEAAAASGAAGSDGPSTSKEPPAASAPTPTPATAAKPAPAKPTPAPAAARRKAPKASKVDVAQRRAQSCDVCVLVMGELGSALRETKADLELSHEAAERKQAQIDGVQKAQTKRWLKNEYRVALAAAVEERLEKVCGNTTLYDVVCDMEPEERREQWEKLGSSGSDAAACAKVGTSRCRSLTEEYAEELSRAALDEKGWAGCATIVQGCDPDELEEVEEEQEVVPVLVKDEV